MHVGSGHLLINYACAYRASTHLNFIVSVFLALCVYPPALPPPTVMVSSDNIMSPGSNVTLTCVVGVVAGLIVHPEIAWTKQAVSGGGDTTLNTISLGPVRTNRTLSFPLLFSPINTSDAGQYTCTATVYVDIINVTITNSRVVDVRLQSELQVCVCHVTAFMCTCVFATL